MTLGVSRVRADFGGISYPGTVVEFCAPWFRVVFSDGDSADYTGHELAPLLDFFENDFYVPRLRFYDFSVIHPVDIPALRRACLTYVESWLRPAPNLVQRSVRRGGAQ